VSRILFVDDEPNVLDGLRRMLYPHRDEWQMVFVGSGEEALRQLAESTFDMLVTDVRMPRMNGIELLEEVVQAHPHVIRIVLSGTADAELTLQSVSLAHQYLTKPADARSLRAALQRAVCLRLLLHDLPLRDLVSQVQALPSIPAVYGELVRALESGEASPKLVGTIMARDMGMTAKVLQLVNSAFFGVSRHIVNPVEAVVYLGMEVVRALVFTASAFSQFRLPPNSSFSIEDLQQHSVAVGTLARKIGRTMQLTPAAIDHAFVGGLLHDIGKLVLVTNFPKQYEDVLRAVRSDGVRISEAESTFFGTSHAEVGAYLLWLWGVPEPVTEVVALHHHPSCDEDVLPAAVAVHVANALINDAPKQEIDFDALTALGVEKHLPEWQELYATMTAEAVC
jgi:putative nucleotidyltransferase with HDIG domain